MVMRKAIAFRVMLALVGVAHLSWGVAANLGPPETLTKIVTQVYGASLDLTPQVHHVLRILGAFMIGIGLMALWACVNPQRHQAVVFGIIVILILRVVQRIVFAREISKAFDISPTRLWLQVAFFAITALALFALRPKSES
jgi:hypothetical protein